MSIFDFETWLRTQRPQDVVQADGPRPVQHLTILTCMDTRINPFRIFGIEAGDAHIIRNAGGLATTDAIRSLILSSHALGTRKLIVMQHTDCGLMGLNEVAFRRKLVDATDTDTLDPQSFGAFTDLEASVRKQLQMLRAHPWLKLYEDIMGLILDVNSGVVTQVDEA
jgi:carbonic anhydrase